MRDYRPSGTETVRDEAHGRTETVRDSGTDGGSPTDSTMRVPPPPFEPHDETSEYPPAADGDTSTTLVDFRIDQPREPREHRPADSHRQPGPAHEPQPDRPGRKRLLVVAGLAAVLAVGGGGAYAIGKLTRSSPSKPEDTFVTVTDTTGRLSIRVPPAWKLQPKQNTWPVSVTDRAHAPALRATPDYAQFVRDDVAVPGVFAGVTHDLHVNLPPATLGKHRPKCTEGAPRPYRHGSLSGQITPWTCGSITISEVGLRHSSGQFALWVRVKLTGPPDVTQQILDSIRTKG
jgi:hypothetical protein